MVRKWAGKVILWLSFAHSPRSKRIPPLLLSFSDAEYFSKMAVEAVQAIRVNDGKGGFKYPVKAINVLKAHGKSARESVFVSGYAVNCTVASKGDLSRILFFFSVWFFPHYNFIIFFMI